MTQTCERCGFNGPLDLFKNQRRVCLACIKAYDHARLNDRKRKIEAISKGDIEFVSIKCIDCDRNTRHEDVKSHPRCRECFLANNNRKFAVRRQKRKEIYQSWFVGKKCVICGESNPLTLEWAHHDRNTKSGRVSFMIMSTSVAKTLEETQKCSIKCSNCHRKETEDENNSWRSKYMRDGKVPTEGFGWRRNAFILQHLLSNPCRICKETDIRCLDLDHIDPSTKSFSVGECCGASVEKIRPEIKKCQVLCVNDHK